MYCASNTKKLTRGGSTDGFWEVWYVRIFVAERDGERLGDIERNGERRRETDRDGKKRGDIEINGERRSRTERDRERRRG